MDDIITIIGAGVVGLSIAKELATKYENIFVLEKSTYCGEGQSGHNSGIIHAGLYYPKESKKSEYCIKGNQELINYCFKKNIPHRRQGKLVVARNKDEEEVLEKLRLHTVNCNVPIRYLATSEIKGREQELNIIAAIYSPTSGILDQGALIAALRYDAEQAGANILVKNTATRVERRENGYFIKTNEQEIETRILINCAGLYADDIAKQCGITDYTIHPCRGEYAMIKGDVVRNIIYPAPNADGSSVGVHFMRTTGGEVLVGPTAEYLLGENAKENYEENRKDMSYFYEYTKTFFPIVKLEDFSLGYTGIRAKLRSSNDKGQKDFVLEIQQNGSGVGIHLLGIDSPGLTSCLPLAREVGRIIKEKL